MRKHRNPTKRRVAPWRHNLIVEKYFTKQKIASSPCRLLAMTLNIFWYNPVA
jgi:hypothetical protein